MALGKTIDDGDYTDTLLVSLRASYDHEIASILRAPRWAPRQSLPKSPLNSSPMDMNDAPETKVPNKDQEEAFAAEANMKDIKHHNCKKRGHVKAKC